MSDTNYPVELSPPDIEPYRKGNTGIDYITTLRQRQPGPHVAVFALTHGNEICGAIAVDRLFKLGVKPARGKLSLAFSNVGGVQNLRSQDPSASRFIDEDINRVWDVATLDGPRKSAELARARQIRPFIDTVDTLLDIHSMQHATPALMLAGLLGKSLELAHKRRRTAHHRARRGPRRWPPHARLRRLRRSCLAQDRIADRVRPALGARLRGRRARCDLAIPRGVAACSRPPRPSVTARGRRSSNAC